MKFDLEKDKLLILLVITDLVFVFLHILYVYTDLLPSSLYSLSRDRGYSEFFQFAKELWIIVLFLLLGVKQRRGLYYVFSFLFLYFLIDDSLELHERMGELLADFLHIQPALGLRSLDFGELLVSAIFGLLFAFSLAVLYFLSDSFMRKVAFSLIFLIVILAVFGVLVDMIEITITQPVLNDILVIIEEAGEMLIMSVITWFVFRLNLYDDQISPPRLPHSWRKFSKTG